MEDTDNHLGEGSGRVPQADLFIKDVGAHAEIADGKQEKGNPRSE